MTNVSLPCVGNVLQLNPECLLHRRGQRERVDAEADLILRLWRSLPPSPVVDGDGEAALFLFFFLSFKLLTTSQTSSLNSPHRRFPSRNECRNIHAAAPLAHVVVGRRRGKAQMREGRGGGVWWWGGCSCNMSENPLTVSFRGADT